MEWIADPQAWVAFVTLLAVYTVATFSGRNRRVVYPRPILAREAGPDGS